MKTLSILIPSLESPQRREMLSKLVGSLIPQCGVIKSITSDKFDTCVTMRMSFDEAEIITAVDNKQITTGAKRNILLGIAQNDYIVFIDDDDTIPDYYVEEVLKAIQSGADCIATNGTITTNGQDEMQWFLSMNYPNITKKIYGKDVYWRTTNHLSPVRRELALKAAFPNKSNAEDKAYSIALNPHLKTEVTISKPMYHYRYLTTNKEYK